MQTKVPKAISHHLFKIISHPFDELKVVAFINDVPGDRLEAGQAFYALKHIDVVDNTGVEVDGRLAIELKVEVGKR